MAIPTYRLSAFDAYRVAQPYTLADIINRYSINANVWGQRTTGGASIAHEPDNSAIGLTVGTANSDLAELQTHEHFRYQAGKGQRIIQTMFLTSEQDDQRARWGYFTADDGLFWEYTDGVFYVVVRSKVSGSVVDTRTAAANFNAPDVAAFMATLDLTKGNIFEMKFQWLGVGVVSWFINGTLVHTISHPGTIAGPYMRHVQLPLRYELENTALTTANTLHVICASVMSEGGEDPPESGFAATRLHSSVSNTELATLAIRPGDAFNSLDNRVMVIPDGLNVGALADGIVRVYLRPDSVDDGTFADHNSESGAEVNDDCTAFTLGSGQLIGQHLVDNGVGDTHIDIGAMFERNARHLFRRFPETANNGDVLLITIEKRSGGSTDFYTTLSWREINS